MGKCGVGGGTQQVSGLSNSMDYLQKDLENMAKSTGVWDEVWGEVWAAVVLSGCFSDGKEHGVWNTFRTPVEGPCSCMCEGGLSRTHNASCLVPLHPTGFGSISAACSSSAHVQVANADSRSE